ncbi:Hsp70 family protein [Catellatospora sichuanensis]|uniref:Hsp70 family protein n=1 Tax=Catellatospora sichuanensis TaxID=1969805 RepID=UPI0011826575|nr:Hsp70 family protein [Catellatospora sichuanensis]
MTGTGGHAIGIDFGTSTSLVAEKFGGLPVEIASLGRSTRSFPSLAGYRGEALLVGEDADGLPIGQVVRSVKRAITDDLDVLAVSSASGTREVSADDVIIAVLSEIGSRAAAAGQPLPSGGDVRLGCPAMWTGPQRRRLLDLAAKADLPVDGSTLVDEPIAAGVAWVTHRYLAYGEHPTGRLLVFDMGGGTLDIAVLDIEGGSRPEISVLASLGTAMAGDSLDQAIAADLAAGLAERGVDVAALPVPPELVAAHLLRAAREAKVRLSQAPSHSVVLPRTLGELPVLVYSREQLEEAFRPQMDVAEQLVWAALRAALLTVRGSGSPDELRRRGAAELVKDINYVLLAGGMSRIPYVERRIGALFPHAQVFDNAGVAPDEAIVAGLADTGGYERLNLHRPGFDFVLEWQEHGLVQQHTVYPAYTPFYEPWEVLSGRSHLGFEWRAREADLPWRGVGVLRVQSMSGERLELMFNGQQMDGLSLRMGRDMMVKLYCNGQVLVQDGTGQAYHLRVDSWPVIRGRDHARLVLSSLDSQAPVALVPWYHNKEYAPPAFQVQ